jgi:hypothetical protein
MKYLITSVIVLLLMGCLGHRQYTKVYPDQGSSNIDIDKAQCEMEAINSFTPVNTPVIVNSNLSKKERRTEENNARNMNQIDKNIHVNRVKDLCLKAKGWNWEFVRD